MDSVIRLKRPDDGITDKATIGQLYGPDGTFWCHTLEDPIRKTKMPGKTAIPAGLYEIIIGWSNRFGQMMPRIQNVPYFSGILIHKGNDADDTDGCILVGKKKGTDVIWDSFAAFDEVFPKIRRLCNGGKLFIEIEGGYKASEWIVS